MQLSLGDIAQPYQCFGITIFGSIKKMTTQRTALSFFITYSEDYFFC